MGSREDLQRLGESYMREIRRMTAGLESTDEAQAEAAHTLIQEDALEIQVRSGWYGPANIPNKPEEYLILLATGGPAVRIVGRLDQWCEPETARLECQDWFLPWTEYTGVDASDVAALLAYARCFYFGES